ncbi:MAG: ABC transporter permease [Terracidiphilus sp.]|jgi:hypothetical protein
MQLSTEHFRWVSPEYFETIRLPLITGRFLSASDKGKNYALVSEFSARTLWPGKDPVGQQFNRAGTNEKPFTVIGIVGNARTLSLSSLDPMMVFMPYWWGIPVLGLVLLGLKVCRHLELGVIGIVGIKMVCGGLIHRVHGEVP